MTIEETILDMARRARLAALELANASTSQKNEALNILANLIEENEGEIIAQNSKDLQEAEGISSAFKDRLTLTPKRIKAMAEGVRQVASLSDPVGEILSQTIRPNGLKINKVRTPIGVISIIFESRPNVTIDCAILCLKSGNASILRGGKEAFHSNMYLASLVKTALEKAGLPSDCVQIVPTTDRAAMNTLLKLDRYIDCIIPRGGESLIRFVVQNSTIPVIKHYKGVCNVYVDEFANLEKAKALTINSKCQRPSACNAAENLLVSRKVKSYMVDIARALIDAGVKFKADAEAKEFLAQNGMEVLSATDEDFETEYCEMEISAKFVDDVKDAANFINAHSSGHSDAIFTESAENAEYFLNAVDSSCVYWNASTRFTDGFEFGLGAEIGISTDKLHARGPMGLAELCSYKYKILGDGQIRL